MKPVLLLALCGAFGAMAPREATARQCVGQPPLYQVPDPPQADPSPSTTAAIPRPFMEALPVAFAPSGNQCLGPIPIFRVTQASPGGAAPSTHQMARRLAPLLRRYSQATGMEACARMCRLPSGEVVAQTVTLRSHVTCLAPPQTCPEGSTPTQETIHSHPPHRIFRATPVDALGWNEPGIEGKWTHTGYPNAVSEADRAQAPVWLVGTEGQLIWLETPRGQEVLRP